MMTRTYDFFVLKQYPKERQFVILKEIEKGLLGAVGRFISGRA